MNSIDQVFLRMAMSIAQLFYALCNFVNKFSVEVVSRFFGHGYKKITKSIFLRILANTLPVIYIYLQILLII